MSILTDMLQRLTDNYAKDPESNIGKLLGIVAGELEELRDTIERIDLWRDIDEAEGSTLDRIGKNVQQLRGQATDPVYRILLKTKIARNMSDGAINTIIRVLSIALQAEPEEIVIEELWETEPATIHISVPTEVLNASGFSLSQFGRLVNRIVAAGVKAYVLLEGTFAFSSIVDESENDPDAGYADLAQTTGGYFGAIYDPGDETDLPL